MRSKSVLSMFDEMNELFRDFGMFFNSPREVCLDGIVDSSFPPCDVWIDKDKNLLIEFAIAGVAEDEVNLSYEKDYLILEFNPKKEEDDKDYKILHRGIKRSKSTTKVYVPATKYDQETIKAKIDKGLLSIRISSKEETNPVSILIEK